MKTEDLMIAVSQLDIVEPLLGFIFSAKHTLKSPRSPRGHKRALGASQIKIARGTGLTGDDAVKELKSIGIPVSGRTVRKTYFGFMVPNSQLGWARYALANAGFTVIGDEHSAGKMNTLIRKWRDRPQRRQRRRR